MKSHCAALLLACCASAHAEYYSGNKLLSLMDGNHSEQMAALGYVMGASDAYQNNLHCAPNTVTAGQAHDMVKQYMIQNPALRNLSADLIVAATLSRVWPCQKRQKGTDL